MQAKLDAIGNAVGRYEGERPGCPASCSARISTRCATPGQYDGMLGVISAIECVIS